MIKEHEKQNIFIWSGLFFIALIVCMLSPLNPLSGNVPGTDSSVLLTVARGVIHGKLPYVDFFDHKGPLIYFIDAAGLFLGGFTGVWLIELLFMVASCFFAYKTALFFAGTVPAFLGTLFSFVALMPFFEGGNLTEEYVLPFIFISLYIFTKYFFTQIEPDKIQIGILGACFGVSLLLRPNMFALWLAFCLVIFIHKLMLKEYAALIRYALFFISGVLLALLPALLYLKMTGSFNECVNQYIAFNVLYTTSPARAPATFEVFAKSVINVLRTATMPFIVAIFWIFKQNAGRRYGFYVGYALSFVFSFLLIGLSRMNYLHYNMVLIPLFVPALAFCTEKLLSAFSLSKHRVYKLGAPVFILCVFFTYEILLAMNFCYKYIKSDARTYFTSLGKFIDENSVLGDTVSVLGNQCSVYLFTKRESASKYIYQIPLAVISEKIKDEYIADIRKAPPYFIIVPVGVFDTQPLFELIKDDYQEYYNSEQHII
jgi:hypothetical protein